MRLAEIGPIWVGVLLGLRLFPSRQTAERRLRRLEAAGRLRYAGRVATEDGMKRAHVWCNRKVGDRMLKHETDVMRVFFAFWPHAYALTGADVDPRWRADMEMTIGPVGAGRTYLVEMDEGTEPLAQVRRRLAGYADCSHAVLFVTPTVSRADEVLRMTENPQIYASTLGQCLGEPWGGHWRNCLGESGKVEQPRASHAAAR